MPARRVQQSTTTQNVQNLGASNLQPANGLKPSPSLPSFTRSASPSGLSNIFTKPVKWFQRSASGPRPTQPDQRTSASSINGSRRKPTISGPTDPRPIGGPEHAQGKDEKSQAAFAALSDRASRSVLDLSRASADLNTATEASAGGLGDLRLISRRAWSRSADNLSNVPPLKLAPLNTTLESKIQEYRSGSPATPMSVHKAYPFPIVPNAPATPRTEHNHMPFLRHAHSHSGSTSHMTTPVVTSPSARLIPPSPQQHGAARNGSMEIERSKENRSASGGNAGRGTFSFYFSPGGSTGGSKSAATSPSSPPVIIEPSGTDESNGASAKRASQIVHRAGFVARLSNFAVTSQPQLCSSKNWKPFKLVLKGSKLYFYKPPSDRAVAIRELFPTGLVTVLEEALEEEEEAVDVTVPVEDKRRNKERKRAYWGRATHPDLVVTDGKIERGTFEALTHEAVFGTKFFQSAASTSTDATAVDKVDTQTEQAYHQFATSVLLTLPLTAERIRFEGEFIRCASFLVSGTDAEEIEEGRLSEKELMRQRVSWLAGRYLSLHGEKAPVDKTAWDEFVEETIPDFVRNDLRFQADGAALSPNGAAAGMSDSLSLSVTSPNLGTFSPRPVDIDRMPSLDLAMASHKAGSSSGSAHACGSGSPPLRSSARSPSNLRLLNTLEHEGFTREVFQQMETDLIVRSLTALHERTLEEAMLNVASVVDVLFEDSPNSPLLEFFGCDDQPHWLTRTIILQILGPVASSSQHVRRGSANTSLGSADLRGSSQHQSSRTHVRSEVISKWVRVGEACRVAGAECAWHVIAAALCSKAIARLEKAWKRVDSHAMSKVRAWADPPPANTTKSETTVPGESVRIVNPSHTPWGGDSRYRAARLITRLREDRTTEWHVSAFEEARQLLEDVHASFTRYKSSVRSEVDRADDEEDMSQIVHVWREVSRTSTSPQPVDYFMSMSFAAEPRRKGYFAPYYWSKHSTVQGLQSLLPLAFPEPLPTITFIDRSQVLRSKKVSLESGNVLTDLNAARIADPRRLLELNGVIKASAVLGEDSSVEFGGMILPLFDGELLLRVTSNPNPEPIPSRPESSAGTPDAPPSRAPSIRVKTAAAGLDRKSSRARRSSLPSLSRPTTTTPVLTDEPTEHPFRAKVQAGTLDLLVHLLIHGLEGLSVSVVDDNGEMVLRDRRTRAVKVDRAEFASIWWNVFRSFVTPYVLFQLLRKDYLSSSTPRTSITTEELCAAVRSRREVISCLSEWISVGNGAQDALDDIELYTAIRSFLTSSGELDGLYTALQTDELASLWKSLEKDRQMLLQSFTAQTMRPHFKHVPVRRSSTTTTVHNFGIRPPVVEQLIPGDLVNNIDAMAAAAFRNVVQEDLFVTADLLEVQTADRTGWLLQQEPSNLSDSEIEIQTLYSLIMDIEPASLIGEPTGESLYRLFPPAVRSLIRAYNIIRKWAVCVITSPQIGIKCRQARMEKFLQAIEICRLRNADTVVVAGAANVAEHPTMRSFVEAALTSAVLSPESRLFGRAWHSVTSARGVSNESLASMLSKRTVQSAESSERLTVDPAWLLERVLEVISLPDVMDSVSEPPLSLVNFEKRRHLCNIIAKASSFASRGTRQRREQDRCDFERLNRIEQEFGCVRLDLRSLRDEAMREAAMVSTSSTPSKRSFRPFHRLVLTQMEKHKRDRHLRDRLLKEKRVEQLRQERREDDLNRAMELRTQGGAHANKHRSKRSMSALLSLMRPISTAFSSDNFSGSQRRSPAELDFIPTGKPAVVLSLVDARVMVFINNERSFTFQLDTEDGGHYLLQAMSKEEMNQWMSIISSTVRNHAQRRLTYLGDTSQLQLLDHAQLRPAPASQEPNAVFGVDLETLWQREAPSYENPQSAVPRVLEVCLAEIESRGLTESGIYRVAGATTEVTAIREILNSGRLYIDRTNDIHAVCGVVKYWFRVLPETVIPESYFDIILDSARLPDLDERLAKIREVVHTLPRSHFNVLKRFAEHLDRVVDNEDQNHMTPQNLTTVICPNLLRAPNNNFGLIMTNMNTIAVLFKALITHVHYIFSEDEPDNEEDEEQDPDDSQISIGGRSEPLFVGTERTESPEPHHHQP